ncbi:MAG: allantoate amidohydrolase [Chloroflexota bacterium]|nr:allantoate amidohydrolase [Chloroflexota bacterium]
MQDLEVAHVAMARADALAGLSEEQGRLTRRSYTDAMRHANAEVAPWMRAAGMDVLQDAAGNLVGRYAASHPGTKTLILGSHLDTVRDAGKYDGPLGILVALAAVDHLNRLGRRLPFAVEIICFADEEGVRFGSAYLGSTVVAGTFDRSYLDLRDDDGISLAEALRTFGGDPDTLEAAARRPEELVGYCEVHIEQGPVLEAHDLPVGVVSGIAGQSRIGVALTGAAGHAGTVPMDLRRDALCAAAEFVLAVEALARREPGLVATVGQLSAAPGASNVIPGAVSLTLDVRHAENAVRERACRSLQGRLDAIARAREVHAEWQAVQETGAVACAPGLSRLLEQAIEQAGYPAHRLVSGAGHDAVAMADVTPVAMLFVRCQGGISHNPAESVAVEDVAVAISVLRRFLDLVASA